MQRQTSKTASEIVSNSVVNLSQIQINAISEAIQQFHHKINEHTGCFCLKMAFEDLIFRNNSFPFDNTEVSHKNPKK